MKIKHKKLVSCWDGILAKLPIEELDFRRKWEQPNKVPLDEILFMWIQLFNTNTIAVTNRKIPLIITNPSNNIWNIMAADMKLTSLLRVDA